MLSFTPPPIRYLCQPDEDPPAAARLSDRQLAEALFELTEHHAKARLDVGRRIANARRWRLAVMRGVRRVPLTGRTEDDVWYTATLLSSVLRDLLELSAEDISTAFDLIGVPGAPLRLWCGPYARSRARVEDAVLRELDAVVIRDDHDATEPRDGMAVAA